MSRYIDEKREMISGDIFKFNFSSIFVEDFSAVREGKVLNLLQCMEPRKTLGFKIRGIGMNLVFKLGVLKSFNLNKQITVLWELFFF